MNKVRLIELFKIFLRIGGFTFGGGYAMIPLIEEEIVEQREWLNNEEFIDIIAIVQGIPGIIAVNSSLFIGYKLRGIFGALISALAISLPSVIIIVSIAEILLHLQGNQLINSLFMGIRSSVVILILWAGYRMSKEAIISYKSFLYTLGMIIGVMVFKIHPIILIGLAGIISILSSTKQLKKKVSNNDTN